MPVYIVHNFNKMNLYHGNVECAKTVTMKGCFLIEKVLFLTQTPSLVTQDYFKR